jgi:hypothetical protein
MSRDVLLLVWSGAQWEWSAKKTNKKSIRYKTNKSNVFVHTSSTVGWLTSNRQDGKILALPKGRLGN